MGGKSSNPFKNVLDQYQIIQQIEQFNITYLIHKQSKQECILRMLAYNDQRDYKRNIQIHQGRKTLDKSLHLTHLSRFQILKEDHLCSNYFKIYSLWDYPHRNLNQQLIQRKIQKRRFQQKQLWSILASTILGMSTLQKNSIRHQCLSTKTLLLSNQGILKVADPITTSTISNFQALYNNRQLQNIYLSPQQCAHLSAENTFPCSSYKNDVYSMGIIMLQCGLLKNQIGCYKDDCGRIDFNILQDRLSLFRKNYSQKLSQIVEYMLIRDSKQRPDWTQLQKYVRGVDSMQNYNNNTEIDKNTYGSYPRQIYHSNINNEYLNSNYNTVRNAYTNNNLYMNNFTPMLNTQKNFNQYNNFQGQRNCSFLQAQNQDYQSFKNNYKANNNGGYSTRKSPQKQNTSRSNLQQNSSKINAINIGGNRDPNSKNKTSGLKVFTNNKKIQYTPYSNYYEENNKSSNIPTQNNYKKQNIYTPFDFIRSPQNTQNFSLNNTALESESRDYRNLNQINTQNYQNHIHSNTQYLKTNPNFNINTLSKNTQFTIDYNKNYQHNSQSNYQPNYQFANYQYVENKNYEYKPNQQIINTASEHKPFENYRLNNNNKTNINNSTYNATTYGVQGVKTINSISGPLPVGNFQYGNNNMFQDNKELYKGSQSYQTFIHQQKAIVQQNKNKQLGNPNKYSYDNNQSTPNRHFDKLQYVVQHFKEGSRYQGQKLNDMRHGKGKFYYQDGGMYDGQWKQNKMHGYGSLYYQSGKIAYQGQWYDQQFNGVGKLHNQNPYQLQQSFDYHNFDLIDQYWVYYQGQFVEDLKHGKGKMMFSNGEYFIGSFDRDMVQGQGKFYLNNGDFIQGFWQHNQLTHQY